MGSTEDKALSLVSMVYDAALDEHKWPPFLDEFARAVDGKSGIVHSVAHRAGKASFSASVEYNHIENKCYCNHCVKLDYLAPFFNRGALSNIEIGEQVISLTEQAKTEIHNDSQSTSHVMRAILAHNDNYMLQFVAQREKRAHPFGEDERRLMNVVVPHVTRAVQVHQKISSVTIEKEWALGALDLLRMGVILTNSQGAPLSVNRAAEQMMTNKEIRVCGGRLILNTTSETELFQKLIAGAACSAQRETTGEAVTGGDMRITLPNKVEFLHCLVTPVSPELSARLDISVGSGCVAVFLSKPGSLQLSPKRLAVLYGLSPAESRLAAKLAALKSLGQAAIELGVAMGTVRTQLSAVFAKTGARGQSELLMLMATGALVHSRS